MGITYLKKNNLQKSESYLLRARTIKKELGEQSYEATVLNNLGELKLTTGNYKQAELYLNEAERLIRQSSLADLSRNLELKIQLYKAIRNPASALQYAEELILVNDSLLNKDKAESLIAMQLQYETEKKEQQILLLENNKRIQEIEIDSKKSWITILIIVTCVILIAIIIIYYQYRLVRLNKDKVENLLKEVHHRVKNNLQILASLFSLQSNNLKEETAIQLIKSSESRVNAMAIIHKKLYSESVERTINMKEYVSELIQYLTYSYGVVFEKNQLNMVCENVLLDVDKAIPVGLIINELVSNAMKYAFINQPNPILTIQLQQKEDQMNIKIADNGSGMALPVEDISTNSFGLKMVSTLVKELKGTLQTQTENGTIFIIQFPNR
jgi:two-component system, sensor histidine kinase PdtaS